MSLLSPSQIHQVLKETQSLTSETLGGTGIQKNNKNLRKLLSDANLSPEEVLENLASLMRSGENDGVRLRAAECAAKINGLLNSEESKSDFNVTIIIHDSEFSGGGEAGSGANPIFLPR